MLVSGVIGGIKWHEYENTQLNKLLPNYAKLRYYSARRRQSAKPVKFKRSASKPIIAGVVNMGVWIPVRQKSSKI